MAEHTFTFRVRYAETDQMGTFYNARALEWFEVARSELSRSIGLPYTEWEKRGIYLPLVEAHANYKGTARYDDLLELHVVSSIAGHVKLRFDYEIRHAEGERRLVATGYTVHPLVTKEMKPVRIPDWVRDAMGVPPAPSADAAKGAN
jgi:acyl-CoA thioester hydrolase